MVAARYAPQRYLHRAPDPARVHELYASRFVDQYDTRAALWERWACRRALQAFERRLSLLPKRPLRVLDVGCGTARNLRRLARAEVEVESYLGVDSSTHMLRRASLEHPYTRAEFAHCDAIDALSDGSRYDLIVVTWVLSHHDDPEALLSAATNALSDSGRLMILALTANCSFVGRLHAERFRRILHARPIDPALLELTPPIYQHVSAGGLMTMSEIASRTS